MLELLVESWIWYGVVLLVAISRFVSRYMTFGTIKKYQIDDYLMILTLCFYTVLIPVINIVRDHDSNLLPPHFDPATLTAQDVARRAHGSKLILVVEQCQCVTIWLAKACVLILYLRLTTMRREHIVIQVLFGYVIISFVVMDILYFGVWCRPFSNYWAVPTPNPQCDAATHHLITNAVFNLTSDILMLVIGLPLFLRLKLPLRKKIPVVCVFSLGIFTVLAAILNKVYSFSEPFGNEWTYWYIRESSTALLVANLPFVWALWRKLMGFERSVSQVDEQRGVRCSSRCRRLHVSRIAELVVLLLSVFLRILLTPAFQVQGVSRQASRGTGGDGTAVHVDESRKNSKKSFSGWFRRSTAPDVELESQQGLNTLDGGPEMSAADFFTSDAPSLPSDAEPDPITHPHLFYSRQKQQLGDKSTQDPAKPTLPSDHAEDTAQRQEKADVRDATPPSSAFPSLTSSITNRSAEAYV